MAVDAGKILYLKLSTVEHIDQETGYLERWAFWYCPFNGQIFREPVPNTDRPFTTQYPGGVLLNVPVSQRAAIVARMVTSTASKHPAVPSISEMHTPYKSYVLAGATHILPAPTQDEADSEHETESGIEGADERADSDWSEHGDEGEAVSEETRKDVTEGEEVDMLSNSEEDEEEEEEEEERRKLDRR